MGEIPESDWKMLRSLQDAALDRFCRRVLDEVQGIVADGGSAHDR